MIKDDRVYLNHIRESIRRIEGNIAVGRDQFMASHTLQDAVLRNLQTLAESTQRLSDPAKAPHPEIEWQRIAAFRNLLVHNYLVQTQQTLFDFSQRPDAPKWRKSLI